MSCRRDERGSLISLFQLYVVLRLHAAHHRAPQQVGNLVDDGRQVLDAVISANESRNLANACQLIQTYCGRHKAVVAIRVLQFEFVLKHEPRGDYALREAASNFEAETKLRSVFLPALPRTRHVASTALVLTHISSQCLITEIV